MKEIGAHYELFSFFRKIYKCLYEENIKEGTIMSNFFSYSIGMITGGMATLVLTSVALMSSKRIRTAVLKDLGWIDD